MQLPSGHEPTLDVAKIYNLNLAAARIHFAQSPLASLTPNPTNASEVPVKSSTLHLKEGKLDKDFRKLC